MRKLFPEYYRPTEEEFKELWETATFVFDANVLLNLYLLTEEHSEEFLDILRKVPDRIWMPHQVSFEFARNRQKTLQESIQKYDMFLGAVTHFEKSLTELVGKVKQRERKEDIMRIVGRLQNYCTRIENELRDARNATLGNRTQDQYLDSIESLFDGRIGVGFLEPDLKTIYSHGKDRYKNKIPPGYCDLEEKPEPDCYGDLIIWKEIIKFSQDTEVPIIFVTDDGKEDWWQIIDKNKLGPRPELRKEFIHETGHECYIYSMESFVLFANKYIDAKISQEAIDEIRELTYKIPQLHSYQDTLATMGLQVNEAFVPLRYFAQDISSSYKGLPVCQNG